MDSKKALFALFDSGAQTILNETLLAHNRHTSGRNNNAEETVDGTEPKEETAKESIANVKSPLQKMGEAVDRMVNEGGSTEYNLDEK
ncbi:hypothetical protein G3570_03350 [Balneolaceae bacterium YR4-1]|uniref:Uncharacterized protein n=1 Tax=Halalkalibaculum roseum TaxID=2709311 RepID=A0A6M1SSC1_9BACT|nr:hypothetical protein [Halalkalibaculum roseum]NGP75652.1 hypothetical protein [Halalkalibaculum roseum]